MAAVLIATHIPGIVMHNHVGQWVWSIEADVCNVKHLGLLKIEFNFCRLQKLSEGPLYVETLTRSYPYIFGMFYFQEFFKITEISQSKRARLWALTFLTTTLSLIILIPNSISNERIELLFIITRILCPIAICWIIHACHIGSGGMINRVLSNKFLIPLSTLSFGLYFLNNHTAHFLVLDVIALFKDSGTLVQVVSRFLSHN